ncbi:type II toxin-antitoxin system CcdA family antitoxin [Ottowia sp.]|uniref:type II toxin-antitoxin system CcdA family antitoxin n=1 Tax=Ottowia sp. TaxID=1898956 RepID=UPI001DACC569|nr:type II toxin-antitoxin system CcdA family antitoxin [Ottowia sp.]MCB2034957.1 type II toxin-antitoxin system CcdA family antitoxin [Ottowia sp.]MCP5257934.1 type II toxin-antitoxin system CcdA family antitoxin [Burkholderiaceae bacterium]HRW70769.1 type II toxin-antitoxin system CcdA family antitoxin [Ottowia sp.]
MNAATSSAARKRPVNLTLNEALVQEARALSGNLSATVEAMLQEYVARERGARAQKQRQAAVACQDWNAVLDAHGSFADEHSPL